VRHFDAVRELSCVNLIRLSIFFVFAFRYPTKKGTHSAVAPDLQSRQHLFQTISGRMKIGRISARNVLTGKVIDIKKGTVAAQVRVDIGAGNVITSSVTVDAVEHLGIQPGGAVMVIIKASSVMLGVPG
jgi:molybdopterin-binding protein